MPKYSIVWSKTYHASGEAIVEADNKNLARAKAYDEIGDWEGTMQYDPEEDKIYNVGEIEEK